MKKIAIVEDETDLRELLSLHIEREGLKPILFATGDSFLEYIKSATVDLVILDIMLPGSDGLQVCRTIRSDDRNKDIPIIMLTAKSSEVDVVVGLELGADDYVTKPFSPRELVARVKALFRRIDRNESEKVLRIGNIALYPEKIQVQADGKDLDLTTTEFRILEALIRRRGRVLTRGQILDILGDDRQFVLDRTVDVHILNVRKKLGDYGRIIQTIRGIGYKMTEDSSIEN